MTPVYLYYEVESAFVQMDDALESAQKHATPEGKLLYERLKDELIGIRDRARQDLLDLHTKKAAPAAATTETAKDSGKESTFSLEEKSEDVKGSSLVLTVVGPNRVDSEPSIHGLNGDLLRMYAAAVESVVYAALELHLDLDDLDRAHKLGVDNAMKRLEKKAQGMFSEPNESSQEALVRLAKELNLPDAFLQKFTEGRKSE